MSRDEAIRRASRDDLLVGDGTADYLAGMKAAIGPTPLTETPKLHLDFGSRTTPLDHTPTGYVHDGFREADDEPVDLRTDTSYDPGPFMR